jgi:IS30 family transposase
MWDRWRKGESLNEIGRVFGIQGHSSIQNIFSKSGGIRPAKRRRSTRALSLSEREKIFRGLVAGRSLRSIAGGLDRAPPTIGREIRRNRGRRHYRAHKADEAAWERAKRPKICRLAQNRLLARKESSKLRELWSPEQTAGWLKYTYPDDENYQVSHETIYKSLYIQARGALKTALLAHLRRKRMMRHGRSHTQKTADQGRIKDMVSIRERPPSVEDRAVPGHWEGDLLVGTNNRQTATLVERHTRYVMLVRVPSKDTKTVIDALIKQAHKLPRELYKSLTWDCRKEMAEHKRVSLDTDIDVYFCDPRSPRQRGSNENTNGLLRQYFPKGLDLSNIHQGRLNAVARQLNERPRKTLDFRTPAERFSECVASTD